MRHQLLIATCLTVGIAACAPVPPAATTAPGQAAASQVAKGVVTGSVLAPSRLIGSVLPTGSGNVLPTGSGNVVPTGSGNVVPVGGGNLSPMANAKVFLADAAGQPYPSLEAVTTDSEGRFTFPAVPAGYTFMVVAQAKDTKLNKDVTLQTLVKSSELGATANVSVPSSFVTMAVTEGQGSQLGEFNAASFRTATEAAAKGLTDDDLDALSDRSALLKRIDSLAESIAELKQALDAIRKDLKDIKTSLDEIKNKLDSQSPAPQPQGGQFPPPQGGQFPPPQGGQFPPPQGGGQMGGLPFPGGQQPAPPGSPNNPFNCLPPQSVTFTLSGTYTGYPLRLEVINPTGQLITTATFAAQGAQATTIVPTGCANTLKLRNASGTEVASAASFAVQSGSSGQVTLPF